ncbi:MAG: type IX secretion system protein PorQ [Bacteroidetes bacterium]|nr:type IX secretion system protein PorQ [Bacteroidota bacterium]
MVKTRLFLFLLLLSATSLFAQQQVGGSYVYGFLDVPASARTAALGGTFISAKDNDLNVALQNPSVLNPGMNNQLLLNGVLYFDGVKFGDAGYAKDFGKAGTFMANMHYANYGQFLEADITGEIVGKFHAADYNLNIGWGYRMNELFSVGANLKTIYSNYYYYNSFGAGADLAATLYDSISQFTLAVVAKNMGVMLKDYVKADNEPFPVEVEIAASKRLIHTPFRFNLTYRHLEKLDLTYTDPNDASLVDPLTGAAKVKTYDLFDLLSSHIIFATEILLTQNFHLRAAYNFQRRQDLRVDTSPGTVGLSFGFGIKINKFNIGYGRAAYHNAGAANHFSISTNLSEFIKKSN